MYEPSGAVLDRSRRGPRWQAWLVAEPPAAYEVGGRAGADLGPVTPAELRDRGLAVEGLAEAVAAAEAVVDALVDLALAEEHDDALGAAAVALAAVGHRLDGARLRVLEHFDARDGYRADGAATTAAWYRTRTRTNAPEAATFVLTAVRLRELPLLRAELEAGTVSLRHVQLITRAAIPERMAAFQGAEATLVELARERDPRRLAVAVQRIIDTVDPDGSNPDSGGFPEGPNDPRRALQLHPTIDGLWDLVATLDPVTGETLSSLLDALRAPDAPDTPAELRRTAAQRNHDAFAALVRRASGLPDLPSVHGRPPHAAVFIDLLVLAKILGVLPEGVLDEVRDRPAARLRSGMGLSPTYALALLAHAIVTVVQSEGPWRPVSVGRRMRTLPPYLRDVLDLLHTRCRGPDCDRYVTWTEAHHLIAWDDGGDTDVNRSIPVCKAHHRLVDRGWSVTLDTTTGVVTWTSPSGATVVVSP